MRNMKVCRSGRALHHAMSAGVAAVIVLGALAACSQSGGVAGIEAQNTSGQIPAETTAAIETNTPEAPATVLDCTTPPTDDEVRALIQAGYDLAMQQLPTEGLSFSGAGGEWLPADCKIRLAVQGVAEADQSAVEAFLSERLGESYIVTATSSRVCPLPSPPQC